MGKSGYLHLMMEEVIGSFRYIRYDDAGELPVADAALVDAARAACTLAYAPYSQFLVGAAIRTRSGQVVRGANQENGAFPIGQCAERVALYTMISLHGREPVDTMAIAVDHPQQLQPASPCGACRQLLAEYQAGQDSPIRLLLSLAGGGPVIEIANAADLLPLGFNGDMLAR